MYPQLAKLWVKMVFPLKSWNLLRTYSSAISKNFYAYVGERVLCPRTWGMWTLSPFKNKGNRRDCNNYHGNSLLTIIGKHFTDVVLKRFQGLTNRVYPGSWCGFRANRVTINMIFSLRQLQEKCREQGKNALPYLHWP